jgi:hypothetical protein
MGLYTPRLARRGLAVVRLRGISNEADSGRLTAVLRQLFVTDYGAAPTARGGLPWPCTMATRPHPCGVHPRPQCQAGAGLVIMAHAHSHGWCPEAASADTPGKTVWFARRLHPPQPQEHHRRAPPARA